MNCFTCQRPLGVCTCVGSHDKPRPIHHATKYGKYVVDCGSRAVVRSSPNWEEVTCKSCLRLHR